MATARVFTAADQPINVNPRGQAIPAGVQINTDQNVKFSNNSGSIISINFANTAITNQCVFNDIINLTNNGSYTEAPLVSGITVNYNITMNGNTYGPFAIEVGTGPLEISVTDASPNPSTGAIPPNGEVQFTATDYQCSITWSEGDPFSPAIDYVYVGQSNNQAGQEHGNS